MKAGGNRIMRPEPETSVNVEFCAYHDAVVKDLSILVDSLRRTLGVSVVAKVAGIGETRAVHQWADGQRSVRSRTVEAKLRLAYQAVSLLSRKYSPEVAARWFEQPSPELDYRSPQGMLASATPEEAGSDFMAAARQFTDLR